MLYDTGSSKLVLCDKLEGWDGVGGACKREGTCVYLWLIHVDVWQKPTQYCKAIILHIIINPFKKNLLSKQSCFTDKQMATCQPVYCKPLPPHLGWTADHEEGSREGRLPSPPQPQLESGLQKHLALFFFFFF